MDEDDWSHVPSPVFARHFATFLDTVDPAAVTTLVVGSWGYAAANEAPTDQLVAAAARLTNLRALFLGDITCEECEISWIRQRDVTGLLTAYPRLEVLRARGAAGPYLRVYDRAGNITEDAEGLSLRPVRHGALRELVFESGGLAAETVRAVGECDFPALERLELWLGTRDYGGDVSVDDLAGWTCTTTSSATNRPRG